MAFLMQQKGTAEDGYFQLNKSVLLFNIPFSFISSIVHLQAV